MSILDVFQAQRIKPQESFRTGLFFGNTGQPVFVLATTCPTEARPYLLKDPSEIWDLIPNQDQIIDKLAHDCVASFFKSGGQTLSVLLLSVPSSETRVTPQFWSDSYFNTLLGKTESQPHMIDRTGFKALLNFDASGDLICFPQAAFVLDSGQLKYFYTQVLLTLEDLEPWFLLIDPPYFDTTAELSDWLKGFDSLASAVYFPWVSLEGIGFLPPSPVISAQIQLSDKAHTIADAPANYQVHPSVFPLKEISPSELQSRDFDSRINFIRRLPNRDLTLWGCYTLSRNHDQPPSRLLHISRTLRSIKDAVIRIAEPFIFEPRTQDTCERIEERLNTFLTELETKNILIPTLSDGISHEVRVNIDDTNERRTEPMIHIHASISLERASERLGIQFDL